MVFQYKDVIFFVGMALGICYIYTRNVETIENNPGMNLFLGNYRKIL